MKELLIGCGKSRVKKLYDTSVPDGKEWKNLTTLDFDASFGADVVHDLEVLPYPFADNTFDEIHAYEVLEHTGAQGDWKFFFEQFSELHRILVPKGRLYATVPMWNSLWAWGDPSHKRVLSTGSLVFLHQAQYEAQSGKTPMTDFCYIWKKDFEPVYLNEGKDNFTFVLQANK